MKLTDRDIKSILKVFSAKELIRKYIDNKVKLSSKQLDLLIQLKNEVVGNE